MKEYGVSEETIDDTYNAMAINLRRNASRNTRAVERVEYTEEAKQHGFDDVMAYMRSEYNPKITHFIRKSGVVLHNVAASAIVVCSEDVAQQLKKRSINVVDYASSSNTQRSPYCFHEMNVAVRDALYKDGQSADDIDLMITTVMTSGEQLDSAEVFGYLPEGKGYQYELDGRTCFDGDKPINPHGGDLSFGHAFGASGVSMLSEAIHQMRGEAGECQVKTPVRKCLVRGMGGGHTSTGVILELND
jgi:acetyl-CoA C-acetyltransferase